MMYLNSIVLQTGISLSKALHAELDNLGASCTSGLYHDPQAHTQTEFKIFHPGIPHSSVCTVLFHGTGNDALFCWENLIVDLLKCGRTVLTFDLPGHGRGSSTLLNESNFKRCGSFIRGLLAELQPEVRELEAIGYSLGALAALQLVAQDPRPWRALVLMALPQRVVLTSAFMMIEGLSFLQKTWWRQIKRYGWDASFPAFGMVRRRRFPIRMDPDIRMNYPDFVGHLLNRLDARATLSALPVPVLLLYGDRDHLARADYGRELSPACRMIAGANHFLLPLLAPAREQICSWLTSPQPPAGS